MSAVLPASSHPAADPPRMLAVGLPTVSGQIVATAAARQAVVIESPTPYRGAAQTVLHSASIGECMSPLPAGYRPDHHGRLVPVERIKPIDLARDELVAELVAEAQELSLRLQRFKARAFADVAAFIELSAERYGARVGGRKGNVALLSFDGRHKVQRAIQDTLVFDEGLIAAKALIDECVHEWTADARSEVRALVNDAFLADRAGQLSTARILRLRRLDIRDGKWLRAMDALNDALQVQCSKSYLRLYERVGDSDTYRPIVLDLAGV